MIHAHLRLWLALVAASLVGAVGAGGCGNNEHAGFVAGNGSGQPVDGSSGSDGGSFFGDEAGIGFGDGGAFGGGGDGGMKISGLYFNPPSATVTVTSTMPAAVPFTLMAKQPNGGPDVAVTPEMGVFTRADLATMTLGNPVNLTPSGHTSGQGTLQGIYDGAGATAQLTIQVHLSNTGMGVDPAAPGALDGATAPDPTTNISPLLYPYDKTVFPLGLTSPLVMWNAPKAGDVYRLHYEEKDFTCDDYEVVMTPQLRIPQDCWDWLTSSNQGDPVQVTLSRWDASTKMAYVSAKETWTLAHANMQGAIYYWTAQGDSQEDAYLARINTGAGATPQPIFDMGGQHTCMACHAVSADGTTLVAVAGDGTGPSPAFPGENTNGGPPTSYCAAGNCQEDFSSDDRAWISFNITQMAPYATVRHQSTYFGGNVAVSPDGKYTVFGDVTLFLADTTSGMVYTGTGLDNVALDPTNVGLMMPAFSPDGKHLAAIEGPPDPSDSQPSYISLANNSANATTNAKLIQLDFNEATQTFSNKKALAPESGFPAGQQAIAYPTYSPDANWIAFHVGDKPTACEDTCLAEETSSGGIYLQSAGGTAPVRLTTLTDTPTVPAAQINHSFEPTFNPQARGGFFWLVFSSERDWGNRIPGGAAPDNGNKRLWIAAIDSMPGSGDPSHPPFFVEGQDETRLNMRGFWALAQCIPTGQGTCNAGFQCCSGYCDPSGICVDIGNTMPTCTPIGGMCTMTSQCCNNPLVQCINGICQTPTSQ